jgi:Kef-type K+ transport system membrane component KefB
MLTGYILLQLIVVLVAIHLCGFLCRFIGLQWVIGEILAGLILGPSLLGRLFPAFMAHIFVTSALPTLQTLGDIGLVLYMFSLGARLDTNLMLKQSKKALTVALSGIVFPLLMGLALAFFLYSGLAGGKANLLAFMLIVGTSLSITAFPVLARLLVEKQIVQTPLGTLALTCAAVDDVLAWCLLAVIVAIVNATGFLSVLFTLGVLVILVVVMFTLIRPLLLWVDRHVPQLQMAFALLLLLSCAYLTNAIGIHPVFGAFLVGIVLPRRPVFVTFTRSLDQVNGLLFLPLYFVYTGLRTQVGLIDTPSLWLICLLVVTLACVGKVGGTLPVRLQGYSWKEAFSLGVLMNTRGLVELIVLNIGLDLGILSPSIFAMLVIMALVTTMMASPLLHLLGYRNARKLFPDPVGEELEMEAVQKARL